MSKSAKVSTASAGRQFGLKGRSVSGEPETTELKIEENRENEEQNQKRIVGMVMEEVVFFPRARDRARDIKDSMFFLR